MPKVIHTKHKLVSGRVLPTLLLPHFAGSMGVPLQGCHLSVSNNFKKLSAIMCALITLLTPVISVTTNYSSVYATPTEGDNNKQLTFSVVVSDVPYLQLDLDNDALSLPLVPKATGSDFNTADFRAKVITTAPGYSLTMKASTSSLVNSSNNNYTIGAVDAEYTSVGSSSNGKACTVETVDMNTCTFNNNSWGFTTPNDTGYFAVPSGQSSATIGGSNGPVDWRKETPDPGSITTVTFAAKVDHNIASGEYTTRIEFQAIANNPTACTNGNICYDDNGANSLINHGITMANQTTDDSNTQISNSNDNTVTLWASNFRRDGYGFLGWNTQKDGKGTMYGPNETLSSADKSTVVANGLQLYAIWLKASTEYTMQTFTDEVCQTKMVQTAYDNNGKPIMSQTNNVIALEDIRDGNVYAVAKLADNKCWMIENLRLGNKKVDGTTPTATLTAENTNNPVSGFTGVIVKNDERWCAVGATEEECGNANGADTKNTTSTISEMNSANLSVYSYGNYYSWYTATAGSGTYSVSTNAGHATSSICPKDWILPQGGAITTDGGQVNNAANNDFYKLSKAVLGAEPDTMNQYNEYSYTYGSALRDYPNNFIFAGTRDILSMVARGSQGSYWSSSAYSATNSYRALLSGNAVLPGTSYIYIVKRYGLSVRCFAGN